MKTKRINEVLSDTEYELKKLPGIKSNVIFRSKQWEAFHQTDAHENE
jgi:hypothetical protein